jgi:tRNA(fMet)-specific endonuclease VapC
MRKLTLSPPPDHRQCTPVCYPLEIHANRVSGHYGIHRARTGADRERRRAFTQELRRDVAVVPVTADIAELAGRIEGEQATRGVSIAFEDLLIGATALHMSYALVTLNLRHFQMIPSLSVVQAGS